MLTNGCEGVAFMPFHFGGHSRARPAVQIHFGADPYVLGETANTAQTYATLRDADARDQGHACKIYAVKGGGKKWHGLSFSSTRNVASNATPA